MLYVHGERTSHGRRYGRRRFGLPVRRVPPADLGGLFTDKLHHLHRIAHGVDRRVRICRFVRIPPRSPRSRPASRLRLLGRTPIRSTKSLVQLLPDCRSSRSDQRPRRIPEPNRSATAGLLLAYMAGQHASSLCPTAARLITNWRTA